MITKRKSQASFTLFELLVVIAVLAIIMGMTFTLLGPRMIRSNNIRSSAEQLASVLRLARQMAMDHKGVYGVAFNIQNAPGSTGQVLNNRSGGHWYQIIGPSKDSLWEQGGWTGIGNYNYVLRFDRGDWGPGNPGPPPLGNGQDAPCPWWLSQVSSDFIGERYLLPKGQARFIALTDEDNGDNKGPSYHFQPTYPRPWFGVYTKEPGDNAPRLYPWGGYDHSIQDIAQNFVWYNWNITPRTSILNGGGIVSSSGFFYEGDDGPITGCVNPRDRLVMASDQWNCFYNTVPSFPLFKKGQPRPLINANWLDCLILFYPDGTAKMDDFMNMRHQYGASGRSSASYNFFNDLDNQNLAQLGPGDMCNFEGSWEIGTAPVPYNNQWEASNWVERTGTYYITIGKDAEDDTVYFPSAEKALSSMLPMFRVGVSHTGEVKVVEVKSVQPAGTVLDTTWQGTFWEGQSSGYIGYLNNELTIPAGPCMPAEDFVTPSMLSNRQFWIDPPTPNSPAGGP
jgi:type II secretory pathway pseudopilin PulG